MSKLQGTIIKKLISDQQENSFYQEQSFKIDSVDSATLQQSTLLYYVDKNTGRLKIKKKRRY